MNNSVFKSDSSEWEKMHEHILMVRFVSVKLPCVREVCIFTSVTVESAECEASGQIQKSQKQIRDFIYYFSPNGPESFWSMSVIKLCDRPNILILHVNITLLIKHGALIDCQ